MWSPEKALSRGSPALFSSRWTTQNTQGAIPSLNKVSTERQSVHTGVSRAICLACGDVSLTWWERSGLDSYAEFWFGFSCSNVFSFCSTMSCSLMLCGLFLKYISGFFLGQENEGMGKRVSECWVRNKMLVQTDKRPIITKGKVKKDFLVLESWPASRMVVTSILVKNS